MKVKKKQKSKINPQRSRIITKSPVTLAKLALEQAEQALPTYSSPKSRQDFKQSQIFAILVLKAFFKTDYRGIVDFLGELSDLRLALGLSKLPHFSTLCYAEERILKKTPAELFENPSSIDARMWALLRTQEAVVQE